MGNSLRYFGKATRVKQETAETEKDLHETPVFITEPFLPEEIIAEILILLPVKSLMRSRCVCKEWYALTRSRCFTEKHMNQAGPPTYYYNTRVRSVKETVTFICGCDGLILLRCNLGTWTYHILNPTTRQTLYLPCIHEPSIGVTFSYIPSSNEYKLVCVYGNKGETRIDDSWEVLTLGTEDDLSLRSLEAPKLDDLNNHRERISLVSAGSAVHYVRMVANGSNVSVIVLSLDLETESFACTSLPQGRFTDLTKVCAIDWNGNLSFAKMTKRGLKVLVLEDYKKQKWGERMIVVPLCFAERYEAVNKNLVPLSARSGILHLWLRDKKLFGYDINSKELIEIIDCEGYSVLGPCYACPPSVVTLKGMKSRRKNLSDLRSSHMLERLSPFVIFPFLAAYLFLSFLGSGGARNTNLRGAGPQGTKDYIVVQGQRPRPKLFGFIYTCVLVGFSLLET